MNCSHSCTTHATNIVVSSMEKKSDPMQTPSKEEVQGEIVQNNISQHQANEPIKINPLRGGDKIKAKPLHQLLRKEKLQA